ncbi:hypothetical protein STENM327S_02357 [Streptomyces tendae]
MADPRHAEPHRSAHVDTFARDHLPPPEQWPRLLFDLPELRYPARLNCAVELLTGPPDDRPVFRTASGDTWTYGGLRDRVDRIAHVLTGTLGVVPGNRVLLRGPTATRAYCTTGSNGRTRRPRRPTATTSSPWTPGATCPTRTPGCPPGCCRRTGPAPARRPSSGHCTSGCATRVRTTRRWDRPHSPASESPHTLRGSVNPQPPQTLFSGSPPTVRTHESRTQLEPGPHRDHRPPGTESTPGGEGESEG